MNDKTEMNQLKEEISQTVAEKEALKQAIESGKVSARTGLRRLAQMDANLSILDSRYKKLWDKSQLI